MNCCCSLSGTDLQTDLGLQVLVETVLVSAPTGLLGLQGLLAGTDLVSAGLQHNDFGLLALVLDLGLVGLLQGPIGSWTEVSSAGSG